MPRRDTIPMHQLARGEVDIHGAAALLGLSTSEVWNVARNGEIPSRFLGESRSAVRVFPRAELQRIAAERATKAA